MTELVKIFIAGLILANGPCLFICAPVILPCITGLPYSREGLAGWKTGLKFAVVFSSARLTAYGFLGWASVIFYRFVFGFITPGSVYVKFALSFLIVGIGIFYFFNNSFKAQQTQRKSCNCLRLSLNSGSVWHMALFGLLIGFSPCPPLLAMLTYISATASNPWAGLAAGLIFGLGTLVTPLIPLSIFTGLLADKAKRFSGMPRALRFLSAIVLIYFGLRLIL